MRQPNLPLWPPPGPRDAVGWRNGMSCLGTLSLLCASFASIFFFGWAASAKTQAIPFPAVALLGFVPAVISLALGVWTWRTRRIWWLRSLLAIAGGALGLALAAGFIAFGIVLGRLA